MNLINVIPIARSAPKKELSYFSSNSAKKGSIVFVSLRKKKVPALVISSSTIKEKKAVIKDSAFALKKIESVKADVFLIPEFIDATKETAIFFASPPGAVLKSLIPAKIFEIPGLKIKQAKSLPNKYHQTVFIQGTRGDRFRYYKNIIREEFAKNKSVFISLPTISEIGSTALQLQQGIKEYTIVIHNELTKKSLKEALELLKNADHPLLVISTGLFLCLADASFGTIILDHESSSHYKLKNRPFIDFRTYALFLSRILKNRFVLGDLIPKLETYWQEEQGLISSISHAPRVLTKAGNILVNMQEFKGEKFKVISPELKEIILKNQQNRGKILLFVNRRGHSPTTICNDCGKTITCPHCSAPLVLHLNKSKTKRKMICHKCLSLLEAVESCPYCKSWRLQTLGIGIQKVSEEIQKIIPDIKLFQLDSDVVKTKKQGKELVKNFLSEPASVLLATELLFSYFNEESSFEHIAVISIDNLFTLPDFRMNERLFHLLMSFKMMAKKTFLIQTRLPEQKLFDFALGGNISGFLREEIEARRRFQYPPFRQLIKISREGENNINLQKETKKLIAYLNNFSPIEFPSFIAKIKGKYRWNILLKLKSESWPDLALSETLSSLTPSWQINVDPDSLL